MAHQKPFVPISAYRLQMGPKFRFRDAEEIIPYLYSLGVNTIYLSPFQQTVEGSLNPYEITNFDQFNPPVGTEKDYSAFCKTLKKYKMGQVIDLVVNHMARSSQNPWFYDVLEKGKRSPYAPFFDIDWDFGADRVILPVLGETLEEAVEKKHLKVQKIKGRWIFAYQGMKLPINQQGQEQLNTLKKGHDLFALHDKQHYELISWHRAHHRVNFRRFFDIHELIGLKMEDPQVFKAFHKWPIDEVKKGNVHGFRIDHPDGLYQPKRYFLKLKKTLKEIGKESFFIAVEKILQYQEEVRGDWKVSGNVGYDYMNLLGAIFVDKRNERAFNQIYQNFLGKRVDPVKLLYDEKYQYAHTCLPAEFTILSGRIHEVLQEYPLTKPIKEREIFHSLVQILCHFPCYRSYIDQVGQLCDEDLIFWQTTLEKWQKKEGKKLLPHHTSFWKQFFYLKEDKNKKRQKAFFPILLRIQQLLPALFAKGFEDTHLYVYNRLTSLNEVGGMPSRFGLDLAEFHKNLEIVSHHYPQTMNAGSTHDTKRSEDVRMRISALSEMPIIFDLHLKEWHAANKKFLSHVAEEVYPDPNVEYFFYQTLLGFWPQNHPKAEQKKELIKRVQDYLLKSLREAKVYTNWVENNQAYETAVIDFVARVLKQPSSSKFWKSFDHLNERIYSLGLYNSLSSLTLRLGSPGAFDIYQGTEVFKYSLVDPDNRRPVSFKEHAKLLAKVQKETEQKTDVKEWLHKEFCHASNDKLKIYLLHQGLKLRNQASSLFVGGKYVPLEVSGPLKNHVVAFMRQDKKASLLVFSLRFFHDLSLLDAGWKRTFIELPSPLKGENIYTKEKVSLPKKVPLEMLLDPLPMGMIFENLY